MIPALGISGPHGIGKSTVIRALCATYPNFSLHPRSPVAIPDDFEPFTRAWLRINKYALEAMELRAISSPKRPRLLDRCVFDSMAYTDAYWSLGWITTEERDLLAGVIDVVAKAALYPSHVAVLIAPASTIRERLERRWRASGIGWREEDGDYLQAVCSAYERLRATVADRYSAPPTIFVVDASRDILPDFANIGVSKLWSDGYM